MWETIFITIITLTALIRQEAIIVIGDGAATILGTTHGTHLGTIVDGTIRGIMVTDGIHLGITEVGIAPGTMEDGMIPGIMEDGTIHGITGTTPITDMVAVTRTDFTTVIIAAIIAA